MAEKVVPGPVEGSGGIREAVCVHTRKIYDSCRDKDCAEALRFYPTEESAPVIETAQSVKGGSAELLYVDTRVEPVNFNRGYYTVDMRFYYAVRLVAYAGGGASGVSVEGLCTFDKRAMLFGSEGSAKIFSSRIAAEEGDARLMRRSNLPEAVVEAVDPIVLEAKLDEAPQEKAIFDVPAFVQEAFASPLQLDESRVAVTLGQFSLVRLERDTQMLVPVYDYCMPEKECDCGDEDDPCSLFRNIAFPVGEFFPPNTVSLPEEYAEARSYCSCSR